MNSNNQRNEKENNSSAINSRFVVSTNNGIFYSSYVVYACNAWCRDLLPSLSNIIIPVRNQVIITSPLPSIWPFSIGMNYGYEYMMQRPDGRIVLGLIFSFD